MSTAVGGLSLVLLTIITMVAFAANSLLCRYALGLDLVDAASFSALRLITGATFLLCLVYFKDPSFKLAKPRIVPVLSLLAYMLGFSFAYNQLSAATGALLLFGFVQFTMLAYALRGGERLTLAGIAGYSVAVSGLLYLVAPGLESPPLAYAGLMAIAGVAWGIYSVLGAGGRDPTQATAQNFFYASLIAIVINFSQIQNFCISWQGALAASSRWPPQRSTTISPPTVTANDTPISAPDSILAANMFLTSENFGSQIPAISLIPCP